MYFSLFVRLQPHNWLLNTLSRETTKHNITKKGTFQAKWGSLLYLGNFKKENSIFRAALKNELTFCHDKFLACYIVVDMFVSPGLFFFLTGKLIGQAFYSKSSTKLGLNDLNKPTSTQIQNTQEKLIVLLIYLFLTSYDSGDTSRGVSETIVSYSHIKQSVGRDISWLHWVNFNWVN